MWFGARTLCYCSAHCSLLNFTRIFDKFPSINDLLEYAYIQMVLLGSFHNIRILHSKVASLAINGEEHPQLEVWCLPNNLFEVWICSFIVIFVGSRTSHPKSKYLRIIHFIMSNVREIAFSEAPASSHNEVMRLWDDEESNYREDRKMQAFFH